jgi:ABC-type multidrug transport system fused ATPase/permease subunit
MLLGTRVSRLMHARMVYHIIHAKITSFLERVPSGRIINRFTSCIDMLDLQTMPRITLFCLLFSCLMLDFCMVVTGTSYYALIVIIMFCVGAIWTQNIYSHAKSEMVRLLNTTRSPMAHLTSEVLRGLPEIRAMKLEQYVNTEMKLLINENLKNSILVFSLNAWFQLRVAFMNIAMIQLPAFIF